MPRTWLQVGVDLVGGFGERFSPTPGRIFIVGPSHTFTGLGEAINQAFDRWDLAHLHEFELRMVGGSALRTRTDSFDDEAVEDHKQVKVAAAVGPGEELDFRFDFGDRWEHRCRALGEKADPRQKWGPGRLPRQPVAIWAKSP